MSKLLICVAMVIYTIDKCLADDVLRCFKCTVTVEKYLIQNRSIVTPLCAKFDGSSEYEVECPYSTMCLKTISTLHLRNGQDQETITRGCAQQKNTTQVFRNKQWEQKHSVEEVYPEGCSEVKGNNLAGSTNTHCYCRGNLCNSSSIIGTKNQIWTVILLFHTWLTLKSFSVMSSQNDQ